MTTKISKNAIVLFISTLFGILTQLIQFVIIGRYFSMDEIGILSIVMVVIMFAQMFTDFGLSGYYVHRQNIAQLEKSTLYWLNIGLGFVIAFVICILSPLISLFYQSNELLSLLIWSSLSFPIIAAGSQFQAALLKSYNYNTLAIVEIVSRIVALSFFCLSIYYQAGLFSIVIAHISLCTIKALLLFFFSKREEYPSFIFDKKYAIGGMKYGIYLIMGQFLNQLMGNLDKILIGKYLGMSNLGVYALAKDTALKAMQVVNPVVNKICLPRYAAKQNDKQLLSKDVSSTVLIIGFFSSFIFFSLSISSDVVVNILYGTGKEDTAAVLKVMAFYVLFRSFGNINGTLLSAVGQTKLDFKWNVLASIISIPTVIVLVQQSLVFFTVGMVVLQLSLTIFAYFILMRPVISFSFSTYLSYMLFFPLIGGFVLLLLGNFDFKGEYLSFFIYFIQWSFSYCISAFLFFNIIIKRLKL